MKARIKLAPRPAKPPKPDEPQRAVYFWTNSKGNFIADYPDVEVEVRFSKSKELWRC